MGVFVRSFYVFVFVLGSLFLHATSFATSRSVATQSGVSISTHAQGHILVLKAGNGPFSRWANAHFKDRQKPLLWLFFESFFLGILAVFTPYVYAILPLTLNYISVISKNRGHVLRNNIFYALSLISIFLALGLILSVIVTTTGFYQFADHWLFNLIFCRIFLMLGLSFLGAFEINLPVKWAQKINSKAGLDSFKGIFFMALSLPVLTISSTGPIAGLVLLFAGKGGFLGPLTGMLGFSFGFVLPFVFPVFINLISKSITWLNHVKVLLGFFSLLLCLKFLSNADIALDWNLIDNDIFIVMVMCLAGMMGLYMLGYVRLSNDYLHIQNVYGQDYVSISRLVLAIAFLSFSVYLLPGLWGAPLYHVQAFLPQSR